MLCPGSTRGQGSHPGLALVAAVSDDQTPQTGAVLTQIINNDDILTPQMGWVNTDHKQRWYLNSNSTDWGCVNTDHKQRWYLNSNSTDGGCVSTDHKHSGYLNSNSTDGGCVNTDHKHSGYLNSNSTDGGCVNTDHKQWRYLNSNYTDGAWVKTDHKQRRYLNTKREISWIIYYWEPRPLFSRLSVIISPHTCAWCQYYGRLSVSNYLPTYLCLMSVLW